MISAKRIFCNKIFTNINSKENSFPDIISGNFFSGYEKEEICFLSHKEEPNTDVKRNALKLGKIIKISAFLRAIVKHYTSWKYVLSSNTLFNSPINPTYFGNSLTSFPLHEKFFSII